MQNDYCEIYGDSDQKRDDIVKLVHSITGGNIEGRATIRTIFCVIDVEDNEDFDPNAEHASADGFLHFRYRFEVEPAPNQDRSAYIEAVAMLLQGLRATGMMAIPACDFEAQLPKP